MGKTPRMLAAFQVRVAAVACHPRQEVVAVGYADGTVLLVRVEDGAEVLAKKPGNAPVAALGWNATGNMLAWGTEEGEAGIIAALRSHAGLVQSSQRRPATRENSRTFAVIESKSRRSAWPAMRQVIAVRSVSHPALQSARICPATRASSSSNARMC